MKIGPTFGSSRLFKSFLHLKNAIEAPQSKEKAPCRKPCGCSYKHKRKSPRLSPEALRCRMPRSVRHSDNLNHNTVSLFHARITFSIDANLKYRKSAAALAISSRRGLTNSQFPHIISLLLLAGPILKERRRQYEEAEKRRREEGLRRCEEQQLLRAGIDRRRSHQSRGVMGDATMTESENGLNRRKYSPFLGQHILASTSQSEVMTNKLAKSIARLDSIPASIRPYFVSQILGRSVPFVGTVGIWLTS